MLDIYDYKVIVGMFRILSYRTIQKGYYNISYLFYIFVFSIFL